MTNKKIKELKNLNEKQIEERLKELKLELIKKNLPSNKTKTKHKEIKKAIARILTLASNTSTLTQNNIHK